MIYGQLSQIKAYENLSANFKTAIDYILTQDLMALPVGKHAIDGDKVYVLRDSYDIGARNESDYFFESHEKYADLQMVLSGQEGMGILGSECKQIQVTVPYDTEKDITKYQATPALILDLKPGNYTILMPEDLHMVKMKLENQIIPDKNNEKIVVKIKL